MKDKKKTKSKTIMEAEDVINIIQLLEAENIDVWLDGGWGVDALLEEQARSHKDLDLVVRINDVERIERLLGREDFKLVKGGAPTNFVFKDEKGREVDFHPVKFDKDGNGIYRMENGEDWVYPAEGFMGKGKVGSKRVHCLTAKTQMLCHTGYKLSKKDFNEMKALRQRFGVEYPEQYKDRF